MHFFLLIALVAAIFPAIAVAADQCPGLPDHAQFQAALKEVRMQDNGGAGFNLWATLIGRDGLVCAIVYTGDAVDAQFPGSRLASAQKANAANTFSLKNFAFSSANLYSGAQPGGTMYGITESNPLNIEVAYAGPVADYGSAGDPLVGKIAGGVNVQGGGLALYNDKAEIVGGLGLSGDSACADHNIAWRLRHRLKLDYVPAGVSPAKNDAIIYDIAAGKSKGGFGHPVCGNREQEVARELPATSTR